MTGFPIFILLFWWTDSPNTFKISSKTDIWINIIIKNIKLMILVLYLRFLSLCTHMGHYLWWLEMSFLSIDSLDAFLYWSRNDLYQSALFQLPFSLFFAFLWFIVSVLRNLKVWERIFVKRFGTLRVGLKTAFWLDVEKNVFKLNLSLPIEKWWLISLMIKQINFYFQNYAGTVVRPAVLGRSQISVRTNFGPWSGLWSV